MGGMGDILLATPMARALHHHFETEGRSCVMDFVVAKGMAPALTGIGYIRRVVEFDKHPDGDGRLRNLLPFLQKIRNERYDIVLNLQPHLKTWAIAYACGAKTVVNLRKDRSVNAQTGKMRHTIDDYNKEIRRFGVESVGDWRMDFFVPEEAKKKVSDILRDNGISASDTVIVVNPAGTRPINRWPTERFAGFAEEILQDLPHAKLIITGGPHDTPLAEGILEKTNAPIVNLCNKLTVKELGALLQRANTVVTGDTGPLHIASAVGAPLVCLSGAADPDRTGPTSPRDLVVINRSLPCVPCRDRVCKRGDIACMTQMPVAWVREAVVKRMNSRFD